MNPDDAKSREELLAEVRALRREREHLHRLHAIPDLIFHFDAEARFVDFRANELQPLMPPSAFLGKRVEEVLPPPLGAQARRAITDAMHTGKLQSFEYQMPEGDEMRDFEARFVSTPDGHVLTLIRDISERKRQEAALVRSESQLQAIIDNTTDVVLLRDLEGHYTMINRAGAAMMGREPHEIIGMRAEDILPPAIAQRMLEAEARVRETGEPCTSLDRSGEPGGPQTAIQTVKFPVKDAEGRWLGVACIARDVTPLVALEAELQAQNERLKNLDQLKSQFVSAVSHELRTPLTFMKGFAEFLEDEIGGPLSAMQRQHLSQLQRGIHRLEHLVDDLLDYTRLENGSFRIQPEAVDLVQLLAQTRESAGPAAADAGVTIALESRVPAVRGAWDPHRLAQVLENLLGNAIKFTPPGGTITLVAEAEDGHARIAIADTGLGIAEADMSTLFQRFSQLEEGRRRGGTGLGLSLAKTIVEAHGGTIGVESAPGVGSTFWFTLPGAGA